MESEMVGRHFVVPVHPGPERPAQWIAVSDERPEPERTAQGNIPEKTFIIVNAMAGQHGIWTPLAPRESKTPLRTAAEAIAWCMSESFNRWNKTGKDRAERKAWMQASWQSGECLLFGQGVHGDWRGRWYTLHPHYPGGDRGEPLDPTPRPPESNNDYWAIAHAAARRIGLP